MLEEVRVACPLTVPSQLVVSRWRCYLHCEYGISYPTIRSPCTSVPPSPISPPPPLRFVPLTPSVTPPMCPVRHPSLPPPFVSPAHPVLPTICPLIPSRRQCARLCHHSNVSRVGHAAAAPSVATVAAAMAAAAAAAESRRLQQPQLQQQQQQQPQLAAAA